MNAGQALVVRRVGQCLSVAVSTPQALVTRERSQALLVRDPDMEIVLPLARPASQLEYTAMVLPPAQAVTEVLIQPGAQQVQDLRSAAFVVLAGQPGRKGDKGEPGPAGGAIIQKVASVPMSGHRMVAPIDANQVVYADCSTLLNRINTLGLSLNAASPGGTVDVQRLGEVQHSGWAWTPGAVFLGQDGNLTQTVPPGALFSLIVGFALDPTTLFIDIGVAITLEV